MSGEWRTVKPQTRIHYSTQPDGYVPGVVLAPTVMSPTLALFRTLWDEYVKRVAPDSTRFYNGVFAKWVFAALERGVLDPVTLTLTPGHTLLDVVIQSDLDYYAKTYRAPLRAAPTAVSPDFTPVMAPARQLTGEQLHRLRAIYTGTTFQEHVDFLRGFYDGLSGENNFLSMPPPFKLALAAKHHVVELFGSPFNTECDYCSALPLEQEYFSARGSFFKYTFEPNTVYLCNPPFDETIMVQMVKRLNEQLTATPDVTVIIVIPDWIKPPYAAKDLLEASNYRAGPVTPLTQQGFRYYNHYTGRYAPVVSSLLYILTSRAAGPHFTAAQIMAAWNGRRP